VLGDLDVRDPPILITNGYNPTALRTDSTPLTATTLVSIGLALVWATVSVPLQAVDLRSVLTGYAITSWDVNDGAPEGAVYALAQGRDGYLWLGTDTGLHRFDGMRFRTWASLSPHGLQADLVQALYVARDGSLWAGFGASGGISQIRGVDVHTYSQADGLPRSAVNTILEDSIGTLWAGTDAGLFVFSGGRWEKQQAAHGLPDGAIWAAHLDSSGTLLVAGAAGVFRRSAGSSAFEAVEHFTAPSGAKGNTTNQGMPSDEQIWTPRLPSDNVVRSITTDGSGRAFVSDLRTAFRSLGGIASTPSNHPGRGLQLMFDTRGNMWVATGGQGVWRVSGLSSGSDAVVERVTTATGLATEGAFSLLEDRHGNIWAGGSPSGLTRLTPQKFIQVPQESSVTALTMSPKGRVWIGTSDALIDVSAPDQQPLLKRRLLVGESIRALHADAQGSLWVGTERDLLRLPAGRERFESVAGSKTLRQVDSITAHPQGGVLIADADHGLLHWTEQNGLRPITLASDQAGTRFITAYTDQRKRVWLASAAGRIGLLDESGAVRLFMPGKGFTAGVTRIIHQDRRGVIWFGGTNGVTRYENDRAVTIEGDERLPIRLVRGITDDRDGYLWIATTSGLLRIHHGEVEKASAAPSYRPTYAFFDKTDGLAGLPRMRSDSTSIQTQGGSLWFVTGEGITIVPPNGREDDVDVLRVGIDTVTVDDRSVNVAQGLEFPAGVHRLQLDFTVLNLTSAHKTRFRFRLEGVDTDWVDAGSRRQATYTNLRSGEYRFRVAASDALGGWKEPEQPWGFSIRPHFYETRAFMGACGLLVLLAGWGAWTIRLQQERKRFSLVLAERARLSREIHDTLLQGLVGVALQCDVIANDAQSASPAMTDKLIRLKRQAQRYVKEARHAIWNLRSSPAATELVEALREFGEQVGASVEFTVVVNGVTRSLGDDVERELLRIAQEAITNAVLHSHACRINVTVTYSPNDFSLSVSDDGRGFADSHLSGADGHYGIVSMRERAASIGAELLLDSRPGEGTQVSINLLRGARVRKVAV
jgi:signal transduction histidine kinase/ligand-binding sensor domain-containing protein